MSSCGTSSGSPCCEPTQVVVDEFCLPYNNIFVSPEFLWIDTAPQNSVFTVSANLNSPSPVAVVIHPSTGPNITYTLQPGSSRTDLVPNALFINVASTTGANILGKACVTNYRKFH